MFPTMWDLLNFPYFMSQKDDKMNLEILISTTKISNALQKWSNLSWREHNNCVLSLELPVKSPCLHPLFHSLFPLSSGICKVNFCKFLIFLKSQYEMLELSMHKVPE